MNEMIGRMASAMLRQLEDGPGILYENGVGAVGVDEEIDLLALAQAALQALLDPSIGMSCAGSTALYEHHLGKRAVGTIEVEIVWKAMIQSALND